MGWMFDALQFSMERKSVSLSKFFTSMEETLYSCDPESCVEFVCGAIVLFEKSFGARNKAVMQNMLKEAVDNFGPDSTNYNKECMIPIYSMLNKYCKTFPVFEIFEKLYERDSCRRCAVFYLEWSRCYADFAKKVEILELGLHYKAEPVYALKHEMNRVLKLEESLSVHENINIVQSSCVCDRVKTSVKPLSTKRALFGGKCTSLVDSDNCLSDKPSTDYDFVLPGSNTCVSRVSPSICDSSVLYNMDIPRPSDANYPRYHDPNAENINPSGASSETTVRRKHAGVLVAALDFTLEDYDLGDDSCNNLKSLEILKREDNETNIRNNMPSEEIGPSSSSISPCPVIKRLTPSPTLSDS